MAVAAAAAAMLAASPESKLFAAATAAVGLVSHLLCAELNGAKSPKRH